ncbi:phosphatase 1 regulatory subunit 27 [Paramuricea clavata]|uniref:Phosphatase 1 regulatory subunit 27 n=1 Tax=Paramuricea clavata TaxID=317549 RepID=A0A6S7HSX7_PARCT|nr:phosphatase 1 regulatory subunit 27 [Paramuricea clavata]
MEVLTDSNSAFSHRRKFKVIKYDSPAFRDQPGSETKVKRTFREQYKQCPKLTNVSLPEDDVVSFTANEMVNACYAKIWRGSGAKPPNICGEEPGIEEDSEMQKAFPIYLKKDLDKLQKLRLKSRFKSRKCLDNNEVKAWIEAPEKFIDILTELREEENKENIENVKGIDESRNDVDGLGSTSAADEQIKRPSQAVHFPQHVLLCAALQEGDSNEIEEVIKNNNIDLSSLSQATSYYYLHKTILNDQLHCARMLIQNGVNVNAKDSEGVSPLALAFRLMNFPMVALLVHSGADVGEYTDSRIQEMNKVKELSCSVSKVFEMDV